MRTAWHGISFPNAAVPGTGAVALPPANRHAGMQGPADPAHRAPTCAAKCMTVSIFSLLSRKAIRSMDCACACV